MRTFTEAFWPSQEQELILKTALAPEEEARAAWEHLVPNLDLDDIAPETTWLLPLLYRRLSTLGIDHPSLPLLKGFYRRTWYKTQLLMRSLRDALFLLDKAGIDTMVLKGAALAELYYKSRGLRSMGDVDVLVSREAVGDAWAALERGGWWRRKNEAISEDLLRYDHSIAIFPPEGDPCDLHWRVQDELTLAQGARDDVWTKARSFELDGVETKALCAADTLLHVCVHGSRWLPWSHLRWLADAATVARSGEVDWDRVVEQAKLRRCVLSMRDSLGYLTEVLHVEVPNTAIHDLQVAIPTKRESFRYRARAKPPAESWRGGMSRTVARYLAQNQQTPTASLALGFPRYLKRAWSLPALRDVPGHAVKAFVRNAAAARASRGSGDQL